VLGTLAYAGMRQSAFLHNLAEVMDGIQTLQIRASETWGETSLPASLPDVTAEALRAGIFPDSWQGARHPFGSAVKIGRYRPGDLVAGKASISVVLENIPRQACLRLLPRLRDRVKTRNVLAIWLDDTPATETGSCPGQPGTIRLALATRLANR